MSVVCYFCKGITLALLLIEEPHIFFFVFVFFHLSFIYTHIIFCTMLRR